MRQEAENVEPQPPQGELVNDAQIEKKKKPSQGRGGRAMEGSRDARPGSGCQGRGWDTDQW